VMKLNATLFSIFTTTLLAFGVWLLVFFNTSPVDADKLTYAAFYASLFTWFAGLLTFIFYYARVFFGNKEVVYQHFPASIRQATLISFALVSLLFFQSLGVLNWWEVGLWLTSILLLEMFFKSGKG